MDGSASACTKITPTRTGWGYLAQRGDSETSLIERFGPLHDPPDNMQQPGTIPSTKKWQRCKRCREASAGPGAGWGPRSASSTIFIGSDRKYAMGLIRGWSTAKQDKEYALQVHQDFVALQGAWPGTELLWNWQKSHTKETTRKPKGNARVAKWACGWHDSSRGD